MRCWCCWCCHVCYCDRRCCCRPNLRLQLQLLLLLLDLPRHLRVSGVRKARSRYHLCRGHGPCHTSGHKLEKSNASQCSPHTAHISLTTANRFQFTSFCTTAPAGRAWSASRRWDWWPHATPRHELAIFRGAFTTAAPQLAQPSRRRVYHFAAPPSTFIRRFNRGGEGMSAK